MPLGLVPHQFLRRADFYAITVNEINGSPLLPHEVCYHWRQATTTTTPTKAVQFLFSLLPPGRRQHYGFLSAMGSLTFFVAWILEHLVWVEQVSAGFDMRQ